VPNGVVEHHVTVLHPAVCREWIARHPEHESCEDASSRQEADQGYRVEQAAGVDGHKGPSAMELRCHGGRKTALFIGRRIRCILKASRPGAAHAIDRGPQATGP
jgi:hypothetical protein